uniref:Uncharacterized protein n=1 Tax=Anopheles dirus TaxID=7168 RepID=A0A182NW83_9DIPT
MNRDIAWLWWTEAISSPE